MTVEQQGTTPPAEDKTKGAEGEGPKPSPPDTKEGDAKNVHSSAGEKGNQGSGSDGGDGEALEALQKQVQELADQLKGWKERSRKWESRAKKNADADDLGERVKELEGQLEASALSSVSMALQSGIESSPLPDDQKAAAAKQVELLDLRKFLGADGTLDRSVVRDYLHSVVATRGASGPAQDGGVRRGSGAASTTSSPMSGEDVAKKYLSQSGVGF